jgi:hypothetical protein
MDTILGHEQIQKTNVVKQAAVVLATFLLWDEISPEVRTANFRYYEPRTGHGSSLSPSIHALIAAQIGYMECAESYLKQAAEIDLGNNMGNAAGGVHAAALGGLWQAIVLFPQGSRVGVVERDRRLPCRSPGPVPSRLLPLCGSRGIHRLEPLCRSGNNQFSRQRRHYLDWFRPVDDHKSSIARLTMEL